MDHGIVGKRQHLADEDLPVREDGRLALVRWLSSVWATRTRAVAAAHRARPEHARVLVRYESLLERRRASPGSWATSMTLAEQRAMEEIMGAELAAFGYPAHSRLAAA